MRQFHVWFEIAVMLALYFIAERLITPDRFAFFGVSPHPYWIGVLMFSLRYGLGAGTLSGISLALLYLGTVWIAGERFRFEDPDFYILPGSFAAVGAIIGAVIDRHFRAYRAQEERRKEIKGKNEILTEELQTQQKVNRAIEQQIVSQMSSLVTLYQGSRNLGALNRRELFTGILDFFSQALSANKVSIYMKEKESFVLYDKRGWEETDDFPPKVHARQGLIGLAGSDNRVVSLREFFDNDSERAWESRGRADALLAGPLHTETGEIIGVFAAHSMEFLKFNSASINLLTLLLDWAASSISKCLYFEDLQTKLIQDEILNVYNDRYFKDRCSQEFNRSKTYSLPFSILLIAVDGLRPLNIDQQLRMLRAISQLLQDSSREIDIVTKYPDPDVPFAIMMMTASQNQAGELRSKVIANFESLGIGAPPGEAGNDKVSLRVGIGSYDPEMKSPEDLVAQAQNGLQ